MSPSSAVWRKRSECRVVQPLDEDRNRGKASRPFWALAVAGILVAGWGASQAILMLRTVTWADLRLLLEGAGATFLRVNAALLISAAWTIPVGVAIGLNPRLARIVQPIAQVLASVPATAFFPILLIGLIKIGGGLGIGSIALMLLGHAVVHSLQRHRRSHVHSLRPARSRHALSLHALAALDHASSSPASFPISSPAWSPHPAAHGTPR